MVDVIADYGLPGSTIRNKRSRTHLMAKSQVFVHYSNQCIYSVLSHILLWDEPG